MSYSRYKYKKGFENAIKKNKTYCKFCGKICYTKKEAQTALNYTKHTKEKHKMPIRMYFCDKCNSYHLTSQEKKNSE